MKDRKQAYFSGHRVILLVALCLLALTLAANQAPRKKWQARKKTDERVYLEHADQLSYDQYGLGPDAQKLKGKVRFRHKGATLTCDSAYFYEQTNSFEAFGHVKLRQADTLTLDGEYAFYDGSDQFARVRRNVILTHRGTKLYTDSLDYDRLYNFGYFFEGGKMVDKDNTLTSDWGEYHTDTREAIFNFDVRLKKKDFLLTTDTLHYDTRTKLAHIVGPSVITSKESVINTSQGYYDTNTGKTELYGRSTLVDNQKELTGDSLFYNEQTGESEGFQNVVYVDKENKNKMLCNRFWYNEKTGTAWATDSAVLIDYSQKDTLYMHADSLKLFTFNIETDSVYRMIHAFDHVRAYRIDMQAVCDSLVYNTLDSTMTMYHDPITWNENRQLLGEKIVAYMRDSTIEHAHVVGQAFSIEKIDDKDHYNQVSSKEMLAFFIGGEIHETQAKDNVEAIYYPVDEKDSSYIGMNYTETSELRMFLKERKLQRIWMPKATNTMYPMTQIPPGKSKLRGFAWFDYIRPLNKDDIFEWRGKKAGTELLAIKRHSAPLQTLGGAKEPPTAEEEKDDAVETTGNAESVENTETTESDKQQEP